jgi:hypothetical protein
VGLRACERIRALSKRPAALALGVIWRHGTGPVTAAIALIVVPYFFTGPMAILHGTAANWLLCVTPAAASAVQQVLPAYSQVSNAYIPPARTWARRSSPSSPSPGSTPPA